MDTPISIREINRAKMKKYGIVISFLVMIILFFYKSLDWFQPESSLKDLTIATVEKGNMLQTLNASGTIIPAFEYTINAPVVTEIIKIYLTNGAEVDAGIKIMELDQEFTVLEYEKLNDELMLRKNNISKLNLQLDKDLNDIQLQNQIKALQIDETNAQILSQVRLQNVGGASLEDIEKVKLQLKIMQIEKSMLDNELKYKKSFNHVEKQNLELEYNIQSKRLKELSKKLTETIVIAKNKGVITWINENLGKTVQQGEPLVRIANLDSYRVEATTSDRNMQWLNVGTPVIVRINNTDIQGTIYHTLPTIENNTIKFHISLQDPNHVALRPNMRADISIVVAEKQHALRVKLGPAITSGNTQEIFKVKDNIATKVKIEKGMTNSDYVEIVDGLDEGDQIIISDTKKLNRLSQFKIKAK